MYVSLFLFLFSPPDAPGDKSVEESPSTPVNNDPEEEEGGRIVPQLKIGADGTIQIDEERYYFLKIKYTCHIEVMAILRKRQKSEKIPVL